MLAYLGLLQSKRSAVDIRGMLFSAKAGGQLKQQNLGKTASAHENNWDVLPQQHGLSKLLPLELPKRLVLKINC